MTQTIIVIPTYDEAGSVRDVLDRVLAAADVHVLVVDDNSPDGTAGIVRAHPAYGTRVHLLERTGKDGLGAAYRAGFGWALEHGYAVVGQMDADLSHPPEALPAMLGRSRPLGGDADVVIGSRYVRGGATENWPLLRQLISRGGNVYVRLVLGVPVRDATAGYRLYAADVLPRLGVLDSASNGYSFQVENTWRAVRAGLRIAEVPITFTERATGESKMSRDIVREAMGRVLRWRLEELREAISALVRRRRR